MPSSYRTLQRFRSLPPKILSKAIVHLEGSPGLAEYGRIYQRLVKQIPFNSPKPFQFLRGAEIFLRHKKREQRRHDNKIRNNLILRGLLQCVS